MDLDSALEQVDQVSDHFISQIPGDESSSVRQGIVNDVSRCMDAAKGYLRMVYRTDHGVDDMLQKDPDVHDVEYDATYALFQAHVRRAEEKIKSAYRVVVAWPFERPD